MTKPPSTPPGGYGRAHVVRSVVGTLVFTLFIPGSVTVLVPGWLLRRGGREVPGIPWPPGVPESAGLLLILAGAAGYVWCATAFVRTGHGTPAPIAPPRELVASGLYRYSRNPMYVSLLAVLAGEVLLFQSLALLVYFAASLLGFTLWTLAYEEPTLRKRFGPAFDRYCERTRRWL